MTSFSSCIRWAICAAPAIVAFSPAAAETIEINNDLPADFPRVKHVRQVTKGPKHHFFGYYGILPWDAAERHLLCLETDFGDRLVQAGDKAHLCLVDLQTNQIKHVAETATWNFQQGTMQHWLGTVPDREIIYNDRIDGSVRGLILDVHTGKRRTVSRPVAAVAHNGKTAASISFARLRTTRPGYGYAGGKDPYADDPHPKQDGLFLVDLKTGQAKLIVSLDDAFHAEPVPAGSEKNLLWLNHVLYNRNDTRIFFMARIHDANNKRQTAAFTVNLDGTDLRCILPYAWGASHYDWLDDKQMVVTSKFQGHTPWLHVFFTDGKRDHTVLTREVGDGHCHFSFDAKWMVTDGYPDKRRFRHLYLMNMKTRQFHRIASFYEPAKFHHEWRCDLHPRWSRDAKRICIDSTQDGTRQVYIVELEFPEKK